VTRRVITRPRPVRPAPGGNAKSCSTSSLADLAHIVQCKSCPLSALHHPECEERDAERKAGHDQPALPERLRFPGNRRTDDGDKSERRGGLGKADGDKNRKGDQSRADQDSW
jgi:hypothetical protein